MILQNEREGLRMDPEYRVHLTAEESLRVVKLFGSRGHQPVEFQHLLTYQGGSFKMTLTFTRLERRNPE